MANSRNAQSDTTVRRSQLMTLLTAQLASSFPGMSDGRNPLASLLSGLQSGIIHLRLRLGRALDGLRLRAPSISRA